VLTARRRREAARNRARESPAAIREAMIALCAIGPGEADPVSSADAILDSRADPRGGISRLTRQIP
jgi:hypothetical protein